MPPCLPVRTNRDDRYFTDRYQAMLLHGFTRMFDRMLDHANIKILLNTDYREVRDFIAYRHMVYTGPIDEFFNCCFGKLPYRSLDFQFETLEQSQPQHLSRSSTIRTTTPTCESPSSNI
jgi:UDP-galactopyranose mutase